MVFVRNQGNPQKCMLWQKPNPELGWNWVGSTQNWFNFAQIHKNMWQYIAVISVYFRPTKTPIWAETEISPKPPISADTETIGLSLFMLKQKVDGMTICLLLLHPKIAMVKKIRCWNSCLPFSLGLKKRSSVKKVAISVIILALFCLWVWNHLVTFFT